MWYLKLYVVAFVTFLVIDALWLGFIARGLYQAELGPLLGNVRWLPALLFYFLYVAGILYFCIVPGIAQHDWKIILFNGMFFGLICYATYDLTNLATLHGWSLKVVIYDVIWGAVVTGIASVVPYWVDQIGK